MNLTDFGDPLTFPLTPPAGWCFCFLVKSLDNHLINCNYLWCWHSWSSEDESYLLWWPPGLSSNTTSGSKFSLIQWNISTTTRWVGTKLCIDIHGSLVMNPNDPLTFPLVPPQGSHLWFWVKYLNNYWMNCHGSCIQALLGMNCDNFDDFLPLM